MTNEAYQGVCRKRRFRTRRGRGHVYDFCRCVCVFISGNVRTESYVGLFFSRLCYDNRVSTLRLIGLSFPMSIRCVSLALLAGVCCQNLELL